METEARLQQLIQRAPDWRYRPKGPVQLAMCKHDLACKALSERENITHVAKQLELPIGTVRRFAGVLAGKRFISSDLAAIVRGWCFNDLHTMFQRKSRSNRVRLLASESNKVINPKQLARVLGPDRLRILTQYSGLKRDRLLDNLSDELSDQIRVYRLFL
jgi:hypothetical protein